MHLFQLSVTVLFPCFSLLWVVFVLEFPSGCVSVIGPSSGVFSSLEGALVLGYRQMHLKRGERLSQLYDLKKPRSDWKRISNGTDVPAGLRSAPATALRGMVLQC